MRLENASAVAPSRKGDEPIEFLSDWPLEMDSLQQSILDRAITEPSTIMRQPITEKIEEEDEGEESNDGKTNERKQLIEEFNMELLEWEFFEFHAIALFFY